MFSGKFVVGALVAVLTAVVARQHIAIADLRESASASNLALAELRTSLRVPMLPQQSLTMTPTAQPSLTATPSAAAPESAVLTDTSETFELVSNNIVSERFHAGFQPHPGNRNVLVTSLHERLPEIFALRSVECSPTECQVTVSAPSDDPALAHAVNRSIAESGLNTGRTEFQYHQMEDTTVEIQAYVEIAQLN